MDRQMLDVPIVPELQSIIFRCEMENSMYVVSTTYIVDPALAAPHKEAHKVWVEKYVSEGLFRYAGPRADNNGGIIVAAVVNRGDLDRIISEDSYVIAKLVSVEIQEFNALFKAA